MTYHIRDAVWRKAKDFAAIAAADPMIDKVLSRIPQDEFTPKLRILMAQRLATETSPK